MFCKDTIFYQNLFEHCFFCNLLDLITCFCLSKNIIINNIIHTNVTLKVRVVCTFVCFMGKNI